MTKQTASPVAGRIRAELDQAKISGRQLAVDLGLSAPYIARRLSGEVEFRESDLRKIAARLGKSFDDLLADDAAQPGDAA